MSHLPPVVWDIILSDIQTTLGAVNRSRTFLALAQTCRTLRRIVFDYRARRMDDPPIFVRVGDIYRCKGYPNATIISMRRTIAKLRLGDTNKVHTEEVFNFERRTRWRDGIRIRVRRGKSLKNCPYFRPAEVVEVYGFEEPEDAAFSIEAPYIKEEVG